MFRKNKWELFLLFCFTIFSWWLMHKSFGYDPKNYQFRIARHQVGDFALHLSLIRSFSWGDNFPPELPYFAGKPLPYHYYFDFLVGMLEKAGIRIDFAFNGLSILAFAMLLFLIYELPQVIFGRNYLLGLLSVILFVFNSSLTFIDFVKNKPLSLDIVRNLWFLPDYINKGPFDGSVVSIFFTLNVYLNQRHFIVALVISLLLIYIVLQKLLNFEELKWNRLILIGVVLGFSSRFHTLAFFSTSIVLLLMLISFKRFKWIVYIFLPVLVIFFFHAKAIINQDLSYPFINPGFIAAKPLTFQSIVKFWSLNLGLALFTIPLGFYLANTSQKKIFLSVLSLFVIGNLFQLGFRIDHNHSLFNYFFIFANFYTAYFLVSLLKNGILRKIVFFSLLFLLTFSGFINLMAVKNDFQYHVEDAPANKFMQWIKTETDRKDIFLAPAELYDPVTLSGRKNYLGNSYYLEVMGYNFQKRRSLAKKLFEVEDVKSLNMIRNEKIKYLVIPLGDVTDFNYEVNRDFLIANLKVVYQDERTLVFRL